MKYLMLMGLILSTFTFIAISDSAPLSHQSVSPQSAVQTQSVDAKEYTPNLVQLLNSANTYDRVGAAYGLGYLKAKAQAKAVSQLLNDEDKSAREAAKESLEMMGAVELIKD